MSPDLRLLTCSVALAFAQMLVAAIAASLQVGLLPLIGNRENMPTLTGWAGRAQRAHRNMLENLVLFAALVLVASVSGKANGATLLGAEIFLWARLAYAVIYLAGVPWLRTAAWGVSVVGLIMIFLQLV